MNWLFEEFLADPAIYRKAQAYWEQLFRQSLPGSIRREELSFSYVKNVENDGNPIFTAVCRPVALAVRVIQQPVGDADDLDLDWWTDSVTLESGDETVELVISCCPSTENERDAKRLLWEWFNKGKMMAVAKSEGVRKWIPPAVDLIDCNESHIGRP